MKVAEDLAASGFRSEQFGPVNGIYKIEQRAERPEMLRPGLLLIRRGSFSFGFATSSQIVSTKTTLQLIIKLVLHYSFKQIFKTGPKYSTLVFRTCTFHRCLEAGDVYLEDASRGVWTNEVTSRLVI